MARKQQLPEDDVSSEARKRADTRMEMFRQTKPYGVFRRVCARGTQLGWEMEITTLGPVDGYKIRGDHLSKTHSTEAAAAQCPRSGQVAKNAQKEGSH